MIQIYYTDVGGELRVDMKGHGELENMQHLDVMCAVTTVLTNTLGINAYNAEALGMLEEPPVVYVGDDGEGKARILAKPKAEYYGIVKTMFETVAAGFLYLATMHPENVEYVRE
jgi:hypothetical protein